MSLEDETAELSLMYHGSQDYIQELEAGMRDCNIKIEQLEQLVRDLVNLACDEQQSLGAYRRKRDSLQQRAKELLREV